MFQFCISLTRRFLGIIKSIVHENDATMKGFLSDIINLCINTIFPILSEVLCDIAKFDNLRVPQHEVGEAHALFQEVVYTIITDNWRYKCKKLDFNLNNEIEQIFLSEACPRHDRR